MAEEFQELAGTRTGVVVSHRLANLVHADRIYLLEKGRLVEEGTHDELCAAQGAYARFWSAQHELEGGLS